MFEMPGMMMNKKLLKLVVEDMKLEADHRRLDVFNMKLDAGNRQLETDHRRLDDCYL